MKPRPSLQLLSGSVWALALAWILGAVSGGFDLSSVGYDLYFIAVGVVALGDLLEIDLRGGRSTPVSNAMVFALFVVLPKPGLVAVVVPAFLIAFVIRSRDLGWGPRFRSTSRRLATTLLTYWLYITLASVIPELAVKRGDLISDVIAMVIAGAAYLVLDTGLSAAFISNAQRIPLVPIWRGQLQNLLPLHGAFLSVSALIALAQGVLGQWAFVLFLLPLFAARYSFRRYASIHKTYAQTIRALSKVPELAGYAPEGHSIQVAELAKRLARVHGLLDNEVEELEFAALLHDVGRISFEDPSEAPESVSGTPFGSRLAEASSEIVGQTPYLHRVAELVRDYELPYTSSGGLHDDRAHLSARILKVANAYVELTESAGPRVSSLGALHQLESEAGEVYDPAVVRSLRALLELEGLLVKSGASEP